MTAGNYLPMFASDVESLQGDAVLKVPDSAHAGAEHAGSEAPSTSSLGAPKNAFSPIASAPPQMAPEIPPAQSSSDSGITLAQIACMPLGLSVPPNARKRKEELFVDARQVPVSCSLEEAAKLVAKAMPYAMDPDEIFMRRQIVQTVVISMGNRMKSFEGTVDPVTGIIDIDHTFEPIITSDEHLRDMHKYDPSCERTKVADCVCLRMYTTVPDSKTGDFTSIQIASEAIGLTELMAVSRDMSTPGLIHPSEYRQFDFCKFHNFSNTFPVVSVLPVYGKVVAMGSEQYGLHPEPLSPDHYSAPVAVGSDVEMTQLHVGLRLFCTAADRQRAMEEVASMQAEIDRITRGIDLYNALREQAMKTPDATVDLSAVEFVPSILRHLPEIQTMVRLQQGLQYMYFSEGVKASRVVVTEAQAINFTPTSTSLQTHMATIGFPDMTRIHEERYSPVPRDQIFVQLFGALVTSGLEPDDVMLMNAKDHRNEIVALFNAIFSAGQLDQLQTPYYSDYSLHSYEPVPEHIAVANLKPVPGIIEYAPGCQDCFYQMHTVFSVSKGTFVNVYIRYNLAPSEDLRQPRTGVNLDSQRTKDDCETQGQDQISTVLSARSVYTDLRNASPNARLNDFINPEQFGRNSTEFQAKLFQAYVHLWTMVESVRAHSNIGFARAAQAGVEMSQNLCGHSYPGTIYTFRGEDGRPVEIRCILEGTKWVNPMFEHPILSGHVDLVSDFPRLMGNAKVAPAMLQPLNMLANVLEKLTDLSPDDIGTAKMEIYQDASTGFYANMYVRDNMLVCSESIPGVPTSALAWGAPVAWVTHNIPSIREKPVEYELVTQHANSTGLSDIKPGEIVHMIKKVGRADAMVPWAREQWNAHVFSRYLPCTVLFEDKTLRGTFVPGKHYAISFTHQLARGMTLQKAKEIADNVLAVLHRQETPPITALHAARIHDPTLYPPLMPENLIKCVSTFDVEGCNKAVQSAFQSVPAGSIRVEKVATCMGAVIVTCVVELEHAAKLCGGLMNWIKPIAGAYSNKAQASIQWRRRMEMDANDRHGDDKSLVSRVMVVSSVGGLLRKGGTADQAGAQRVAAAPTRPTTPTTQLIHHTENILRAAKIM